MIDKNLTLSYTPDVNLDNEIEAEEVLPTMKGDLYMGRQKIYAELASGEKVWITGSTYSELIQNAISKYGKVSKVLSTETFKEYTDKIFDIFLKPRWKASTANTNKFLLNKHIFPYFKDIMLGEIDTAAIQKFFQTKQHLSKSYTKQMLILLHEVFENAVEDGKMSEDPTNSKRITLSSKVTKRNALEQSQYYDIISNIPKLSANDALLIALLCFTGMRRGEILGLKWDKILDNKILVCAEVIFRNNKPIYNEYTKSASGIRTIPIPKELAPYLQHKGTGFILSSDCGKTPYTQSKFDRTWQRIEKQIELYGATPHVFRHTYLSILAASNVDPKTIQALAGHADFSFTFNKYIDKSKENMQEAGKKLSAFLDKLK